jgi:hypothetical protein
MSPYTHTTRLLRKLKNLFTETETVELVPVTEDVNPQAAGQITFHEVSGQ